MRAKLTGLFVLAASFLPGIALAETAPDAILSAGAKGIFETAYSSVSPKKSVSVTEIGGRTALKMDLRFAWKGGPLDWSRFGKPGEAQRSQYVEKADQKMVPGKDYWYTISVWIPGDLKQVKTQVSLFDLKHVIDDNGSVPSSQFILYPEGLAFESNIDSKWTCGTFRNAEGGKSAVCNRTALEGYVGGQSDLSDRWLTMVGQFRWAKDDGFVHIWFDGKPIYSTKGDTLKGAKQVQFKFGPYRINMKGDPGPLTFYYSQVARAESCEELKVEGCDEIYSKSPASRGVRNLTDVSVNEFKELDEMKAKGL